MISNVARPKISVITATRNAESTVAGLCESLRAQDYRDFEWIVVDGLSSDSTVRLLEDFRARHPWVKLVSEADFGLYHAINKAVAIAAGDYYVVAGADDLFAPDALAQYADWATRTDADVVLARVERARQIIGGFHPGRSWVSAAKVFPGSHSVGMLFRKELHARFGMYSRQFPLLADGYFLKTLLRSGAVKFVDADFVAGTFAEGGMSTRNKLQILAETWQIQMHTERHPLLQTLLFIGKTILRYPAVRRELRQAGTSAERRTLPSPAVPTTPRTAKTDTGRWA
jgi:glycosyltransferase involved in cell wall biosynthesis